MASLKKLVTEFRRGILNGETSAGMCFAICAPLQTILEMCGYKTKLIEGEIKPTKRFAYPTNHYWLELADGRIIDPTADQFSTPERPMPKVYIGALSEWYQVSA